MTAKKNKSKTKAAKPLLSSNTVAIVILGLILIAAVVSYNRYVTRKSDEFEILANSIDKTKSPNFFQTGTLIKNAAGLKKNTWYLTYAGTGKTTYKVELSFTKNSICQNQDYNCDTSKFKIGQNVKITGIQQNNNIVAVSALSNVVAPSKTK